MDNGYTFRYLEKWLPFERKERIPKKQVVTSFLQQGNRILVLQRGRKDLQHLLWGIPGGKLEENESPLDGLIRELHEELNIELAHSSFSLLGTALSKTPSDGEYGLYIYHAFVDNTVSIKINPEEHLGFCWVTLDEFQKLDLLTAQREAFILVKNKINALCIKGVLL